MQAKPSPPASKKKAKAAGLSARALKRGRRPVTTPKGDTMTEQIHAEGFIWQLERHRSANESGFISMMTAWNRNQFDVHGR